MTKKDSTTNKRSDSRASKLNSRVIPDTSIMFYSLSFEKMWMCVLFFIYSFSSLAQDNSNLLDKKVSLICAGQSVETIISTLNKRSGIHFSYNADIIPVDSVMSYSCNQKKVERILDEILGAGYIYKTNGSHLIILKAKTKEKKIEKYKIKGLVYDRGNSEAVSRAIIYDISQKSFARTDKKGKFSYHVTSEDPYVILAFRKSEFQDTLISLRATGDMDLKIGLSHFQKINKMKSLNAEAPESQSKKDSIIGSYPVYSPVDGMSIVDIFVSDVRQAMAKDLAPITDVTSRFQLSLIPSISTNRLYSAISKNSLSFNIISGYGTTLEGVEVGGFLNIIRDDVYGIQVSGFQNVVGDRMVGIQVAGFGNYNHGKTVGIQLSGFYNLVKDDLTGLQIGGFSNAAKNVTGTQVAGFVNKSESNFGQIAGFVNINRTKSQAIQLSGGFNITKTILGPQISGLFNIAKTAAPIQVAGLLNIASDSSRGLQFSGIVNYSKKHRGLQLGLMNFADTVEGLSVGLLSFVAKGYHVFDTEGSNLIHTQISFKTGSSPKFYNIFTIGRKWSPYINFLGYGIGVSSDVMKEWNLNADLVAYQLFSEEWNWYADELLVQFKIQPSYKLSRYFSVFSGANFNFFTIGSQETESSNLLERHKSKPWDDQSEVLWSGSLGLRLRL